MSHNSHIIILISSKKFERPAVYTVAAAAPFLKRSESAKTSQMMSTLSTRTRNECETVKHICYKQTTPAPSFKMQINPEFSGTSDILTPGTARHSRPLSGPRSGRLYARVVQVAQCRDRIAGQCLQHGDRGSIVVTLLTQRVQCASES